MREIGGTQQNLTLNAHPTGRKMGQDGDVVSSGGS